MWKKTILAMAVIAIAFVGVASISDGSDADGTKVIGGIYDVDTTKSFTIGMEYIDVFIGYGAYPEDCLPGMAVKVVNVDGRDKMFVSGVPTAWCGGYMKFLTEDGILAYIYLESIPVDEAPTYGSDGDDEPIVIYGAISDMPKFTQIMFIDGHSSPVFTKDKTINEGDTLSIKIRGTVPSGYTYEETYKYVNLTYSPKGIISGPGVVPLDKSTNNGTYGVTENPIDFSVDSYGTVTISAGTDISTSLAWSKMKITVMHEWKATLHFDTNGGEDGPEDVIESTWSSNDESAQTAYLAIPYEIPRKTGFTFAGWSETGTQSGTIYGGDSEITQVAVDYDSTRTLKAIWKAAEEVEPYTLRFWKDAGDSEPFATIVLDGKSEERSVSKPESNPVMDNATFDNWYSTPEFTEAIHIGNSVIQDMDFYARFVHVLNFNTDGGSAIEPVTVSIAAKATQPDDPVRDGYIFKGWYSDSQLTQAFDWDSIVTGNATIYAKWEEKVTLTVNFYKWNNGTYATDLIDTQEVISGDRITNWEPVWKGRTFLGWLIKEGTTYSSYDINAPVTSNLNLYASWTLKTFTIVFTDYGDTKLPNATVTEGSTYAEGTNWPATPTKTGYTFLGWSIGTMMINENSTVRITDNATFTGHWAPNTYTITFETNGGDYVAPATATYGQDYYKSVGWPEEPTKHDFYFDGWFKDAALTQEVTYTDKYLEAKDMTLYAKWNVEIKTFINTLEFDGSGAGVSNWPQTMTGQADSTNPVTIFTIPADPSMTGHIFQGWNYLGNTYHAGDTVQVSSGYTKTLTAKWTVVSFFNTLNFSGKTKDTTNWPDNMESRATYENPSSVFTIPLAKPQRSGYLFECWEYENGRYMPGAQITITGTGTTGASAILTAKWVEENTTISPKAEAKIDQGTNSNEFVFDSTDSKNVALVFWDFGDGATSDQVKVTHVYKSPGTYNVVLKVTNADGKVDTYEKSITVSETAEYGVKEFIMDYLGFIIMGLILIVIMFMLIRRAV